MRRTDIKFLKKVPVRKNGVSWHENTDYTVTLEMKNTGLLNWIFQKLFNKPKISYIRLDEAGSFIWKALDGKRDIRALGIALEEKFGKNIAPVYERLATYLIALKNCRFIDLK